MGWTSDFPEITETLRRTLRRDELLWELGYIPAGVNGWGTSLLRLGSL